jgi:alkylated DNA repair dioxygenase AlkB
MTRNDFNSCFANLYRHGHDMCGWHSDVHPQLGRNPPVASVSLGAVRVFEFRKKTGPPNFIRFPLFPGSLLLMEGATQVKCANFLKIISLKKKIEKLFL